VKRLIGLSELFEVYGRPDAIRLDNGPEFTADTFVDWAKGQGIALLYIQPGKPNQNAFIERFNRSFREEVLDANLFNTRSEVQSIADAWLSDYNEYRPNESLGEAGDRIRAVMCAAGYNVRWLLRMIRTRPDNTP
jgi:putative transposase